MAEYPRWLELAAERFGSRRVFPEQTTIHVTELLQPPHMVRLKDRYHDMLVQNPMDLVPAMLGVAWHEWIAEMMFSQEGVSEETHERKLGGWTIIGTPDWYNDTRLVDYKTTRMWSKVFGRREWEEQLNVYAWLLQEECPRIDTLEIHAVYLDWSYQQAMRNADLPQTRMEVLPITAWHYSDTERYILARLKALEDWEGVCNSEERWERGEAWAVVKKGRKRAIRLCANSQEAQNFIAAQRDSEGLSIEHRPGVSTRCLHYCPVKQHCSFGRGLNVSVSSGDV